MVLEAERTTQAARWLEEALEPSGTTVGSYVPAGYDRYIRVLNPLLGKTDGARTPWRTAQEEAGLVFSVTASWSDNDERLGSEAEHYIEPESGSIEVATAVALSRILGSHTSTPDHCTFAIWEGYADTGGIVAPQVVLPPARTMLLLRGSVSAAAASFAAPPFERRGVRWWPADHRWCVGAEIYAHGVYVGGSNACIEAISSSPELETWPAAVTDSIDLRDGR